MHPRDLSKYINSFANNRDGEKPGHVIPRFPASHPLRLPPSTSRGVPVDEVEDKVGEEEPPQVNREQSDVRAQQDARHGCDELINIFTFLISY